MEEYESNIEEYVKNFSEYDDIQDIIRDIALSNYTLLLKASKGKYTIKQKLENTKDGFSQELFIDGLTERQIEDIEKEKKRLLLEKNWEEV